MFSFYFYILAHALEDGLCFADVVFCYIFSDFSHTSYLNICGTDLHEICKIGRTVAVDKQSEVISWIPQGTLPRQPIL